MFWGCTFVWTQCIVLVGGWADSVLADDHGKCLDGGSNSAVISIY